MQPKLKLFVEEHVKYIESLDDPTTLEYFMAEPLRMGAAFWALGSLALLDSEDGTRAFLERRHAVLDWVRRCRTECGGFGSSEKHDAHLMSTQYALMIFALYDSLEEVDGTKLVEWIASLQNPDGSFTADEWGESDARYSFCSLMCLALLNRLDAVDLRKAVSFVVRCQNFDGGFGSIPGGESHSAYVFCCVGALALAGALDFIDKDACSWWLCGRQLDSGGFNGRPEKAPDVCYSWWIFACLELLGRGNWINQAALSKFILQSQDTVQGGISDRPGNISDVFHTFFGTAGLSLMQSNKGVVRRIHPVYALPFETVEKLRLPLLYFPAAGNGM